MASFVQEDTITIDIYYFIEYILTLYIYIWWTLCENRNKNIFMFFRIRYKSEYVASFSGLFRSGVQIKWKQENTTLSYQFQNLIEKPLKIE